MILIIILLLSFACDAPGEERFKFVQLCSNIIMEVAVAVCGSIHPSVHLFFLPLLFTFIILFFFYALLLFYTSCTMFHYVPLSSSMLML